MSALLGKRVSTESQVDERWARLDIQTKNARSAEWKRLSLAGWPELNHFGFDSEFTREPLAIGSLATAPSGSTTPCRA